MASDPLRGRTLEWSYEDGPTKGTRFEHTFHDDGTVSYRMVGDAKSEGAGAERPKYEVATLGHGVCTVAYLAPSGWTLTTVLDMRSGKIVSVASNEKQLVMQHGTFTDRTQR